MRRLSPFCRTRTVDLALAPPICMSVEMRDVFLSLVELFGQFLDPVQSGRICAIRIGEVFALKLPAYPAVEGEHRHQVQIGQLTREVICRGEEGAGGVKLPGFPRRALVSGG